MASSAVITATDSKKVDTDSKKEDYRLFYINA
jgi:hypothetical protein